MSPFAFLRNGKRYVDRSQLVERRRVLGPLDENDCVVALEPPGPVASRDLIDLDRGVRPRRLIVRGLRAEAFRVSLFTAGGYLAAIVPDRAADGSGSDGFFTDAEFFDDFGDEAVRSLAKQARDDLHARFARASLEACGETGTRVVP